MVIKYDPKEQLIHQLRNFYAGGGGEFKKRGRP